MNISVETGRTPDVPGLGLFVRPAPETPKQAERYQHILDSWLMSATALREVRIWPATEESSATIGYYVAESALVRGTNPQDPYGELRSTLSRVFERGLAQAA